MFRYIWLVLALFFLPTCWAESLYIAEDLSTFLRSGAGDQYRLIGTIKAGTPVEVVEKSGKYSLIKTDNRSGWVLTSDISNKPSSRLENPKLKERIEELTKQLNNVNSAWEANVADMKRRIDEAENRSNSLITQNQELKIELDELRNINKDLKIKADAEQQVLAIKYFIYGSSVLAIGLAIGLIIPFILPSRRKKNNSKPNGWA